MYRGTRRITQSINVTIEKYVSKLTYCEGVRRLLFAELYWASSWVSSSLDCSKKSETIYHSNYSEKILIASPHNAS